MIWWIAGGITLFIIITVFVTVWVCYKIAFYSPSKKRKQVYQSGPPQADIYRAHAEAMNKMIQDVRQLPCQEVSITSYDGLTLRGRFFEYAPGAPIELMIHGYRGNSERDMSGGVLRAFRLGRSALLIDQRGCGRSDGNSICFGVKEHRDCLDWVNFMVERFGRDVKIILTGISMGTSTVLMAAGKTLPKNVVGVLADCGFSSAKEIIKKCTKDMHLPPNLMYPFIKLAAKIFGHFDLDEYSPMEAMKTCKLPVLFFHGEADTFVPCSMCEEIYRNCASPKQKLIVEGAAHAESYYKDTLNYDKALEIFIGGVIK